MLSRLLSHLFLTLLCLSGCTTSKVIVAPVGGSLPGQVVLRPLGGDIELTRENRSAISQSVLSALRNRGYFVSSGQSVSSGAAIVEVEITQFTRESVLAGHLNVVSGKMRFVDSNGSVLAEVKHTESERGGLLFNSGQVFKGLTSEIENLQGNDAYTSWLQRFSEGLTRSLPKPELDREFAAKRGPVIDRLEVKESRGNTRVCSYGSSGQRAAIRFGRSSFPLREIGSSGRYCVQLPSYAMSQVDISDGRVELTSDFGLRATRAVAIGTGEDPCSNLKIVGVPDDQSVDFSVMCGALTQACSPEGSCGGYSFRLYERQSDGSFQLAGEFGFDGFSKTLETELSPSGEQFRVYRVKKREPFQKLIEFEFGSSS